MINEHEMMNVYKFKDVFVIQSPLMKVYQTKSETPVYIKDGVKVNEKVFKEYSSEDVVIEDRNKLKKLLGDII